MDTTNFAFIFESYKCEVRIDTTHKSPNMPASHKLKLANNDSMPIKFAYQYGNGLIRVDKNVKKKRYSNILGEFLKIKFDDVKSYIEFIQEHGFLCPIPTDRFINIELNQISSIAKRLDATLKLINLINSNDDNYEFDEELDYELEDEEKKELAKENRRFKEMMDLCLFLFFNGQWELKYDNFSKISAFVSLADLIINGAFNQTETVSTQEEINKKSFTINDNLYGATELSSKKYRDIVNGYASESKLQDDYYKAIVYLYANKRGTEKCNLFIDLLYNYYSSVGVPLDTDYTNFKYYDNVHYGNIDSKMKNAILAFAKYLVKQEIDSNIKDIKPIYNEWEMEPNWCVDSLLSALYFSLFYLDSKKEMWKRCKYCNTLFMIKRSSSNKKYCSEYCRRNANAAAHRLKIKNSK